jgi:hypothetical protein
VTIANRKLTSTQRGLGWSHEQQRARLLPLAYGEDCWRCGQLMLPGQALDAGHSVDRALGGTVADRMEHASCNRRAGAILGNRLRARLRRSRDW